MKQYILFTLVILISIVGVYALVTSANKIGTLNHCENYNWVDNAELINSADCNFLREFFGNLTEDEITFNYGEDFFKYSPLNVTGCRVCLEPTIIQQTLTVEWDKSAKNLLCNYQPKTITKTPKEEAIKVDYLIKCSTK